MKTREEAMAEANKAASEHRKQAKALKAEGLSIPVIARVMGITNTSGLSAIQKVQNMLDSTQD
jgi:hypothetical protein